MKKNNKHKFLHRYAYPDAYTLQELKWKFEHTNTDGEIKILQEILETIGEIPEQIIELILNDSDVAIKQWLAKNGRNLDKKIEKKLLNDSNEYVRASAYENSRIGNLVWGFGDDDVNTFNQQTKIIRLAIMRRGGLSSDLIEKIFNHDDKEMKIASLDERADLIKAYLTNSVEIDESKKDFFDHIDGLDAVFSSLQYKKLWDLIYKWPEKYNWLKKLIYIYIGNDNKNKVDIYKKSSIDLKLAIVQGCTGNGQHDNDIIKLAIKEKNDFFKGQAYRKIGFNQINENEINNLLSGDNKDIITSLGYNKNLPLSIRRRVVSRLQELDDDLQARWLDNELDEEQNNITEDSIDSIFSFNKKINKDKNRWWSYGWAILINFIALGIILALFDNAYDYFQIRVYTILVIIYLSVQGFFSQYSLTTNNFIFGIYNEFKKIRKLLKFSPDEVEAEEVEKNKVKMDKVEKKIYINIFFNTIIYLIALWYLLGTF